MKQKGIFLVAMAILAITLIQAADKTEKPTKGMPNVEAIVAKANRMAYYQGKDGRAKVTMTIADKQGRSRNRQFTILRWDAPDAKDVANDDYCGKQKFYVYFHRPADVNKMVFMVWKNPNGDDDRWLYLPSLDLKKRISSTDKRTSFVGSDFFYEDVSGRSIQADTHELIKTTDNYYVVKNTPKDPKSVEFSHYIMHIHKATGITVQVEFFKKSRLYRTYKAVGIETIQGKPTVTKATMTNHETGSVTTVVYSNVAYNIGIPEKIFSERYLKRAPRKYMK